MKKMRRLAFFTGARSDYDLLRPLILLASRKAPTTVLISGAHLSNDFGHTADLVRADGFHCLEAPILREGAPEQPLHEIMGNALKTYGAFLERLGPELLVLLGDRYETFCAALAAFTLGMPIAHLHGGELTLGAMDDSFRHCITKMSYLHFASCERHRRRIIQLGESPERVWNFGAIGVENAMKLPDPPAGFMEGLGISGGRPFFVCTVHPVTLEPGSGLKQAGNTLRVFDYFPEYDIIFTASNADPEGAEISALFRDASNNNERYHFFESLGARRYLQAARMAAAVIGNSSSGIIEVPSLGTPVVNAGKRQKGRVCSKAVIHCEGSEQAMVSALRAAVGPKAREIAQKTPNPYQGEDTSGSIARMLLYFQLPKVREKIFFDMQAAGFMRLPAPDFHSGAPPEAAP